MVEMVVTRRGWSLEKFTKSFIAQAKRLEVKVGSAAQTRRPTMTG
jgi:hypothetical protein